MTFGVFFTFYRLCTCTCMFTLYNTTTGILLLLVAVVVVVVVIIVASVFSLSKLHGSSAVIEIYYLADDVAYWRNVW